jgi:tRNA threonylcarbamoyl adenosine modification protein YeaZ
VGVNPRGPWLVGDMILALDSSSALTSVALVADDGSVVAEEQHEDARRHAEVIGPMIAAVVALTPRPEVTSVACGVGPGPYTGLRVAIASALAIGAAWRLPVHGLCSLDALAVEWLAENPGQPVEVATDARRSELYWASYGADAVRRQGPRVRPSTDVGDDVVRGLPAARWVARRVQELLALGERESGIVPPLDIHGRDTGATADALAGAGLLPPRPLYLRSPDAQVPVSLGKRT